LAGLLRLPAKDAAGTASRTRASDICDITGIAMPRGSAPGERRGGRQVGTPNKTTAEIKALAQSFGPKAITRLAELSGLIPGKRPAESEQTQLGAMKELLDRGYGRAAQAIVGGEPGDAPIALTFRWAEAPPEEPEEPFDEPDTGDTADPPATDP
jgi:hypothetical protein